MGSVSSVAESSSWIAVCSGPELQVFRNLDELESSPEPHISVHHRMDIRQSNFCSQPRVSFSSACFVGEECEFLALGGIQLLSIVDPMSHRVRLRIETSVRSICEAFTSPLATAGRHLVATAGCSLNPIVWDVETGSRCCDLRGGVRGGLTNDHSHRNLLWGCGNNVFAWDLEKVLKVIDISCGYGNLYSIAIDDATRDGAVFATGDSHGIHMWAPRMNCSQPSRSFKPDCVKYPYDLCYDAATHTLLILHSTNQVTVLDVRRQSLSATGNDAVIRSFKALPKNDLYPDNKQIFPVGPDAFALAHSMKVVSVIRPSRGEVLFERSFSGIVSAVDCPYRRRARFGVDESLGSAMEESFEETERCEFAFGILRGEEFGGLVRVVHGLSVEDLLLVRSLLVCDIH